MTKNWTIHQLERKADDGFVVNVHWRLSITDTDESGKQYYADTYSVASYTQDEESEDFIPFENLTKEIVVGWVEATIGEEQLQSMEQSLIDEIETQKNPPTLTGLSWSKQQENEIEVEVTEPEVEEENEESTDEEE